MTLLLTVLTTVTTWAADWPKYITDVILVGGSSSEVTTAKNSHSGYEWCDLDLNDNAGGDYIYLGYKKGNTANTNGGYITDFIIIDAEGTNPPSTVTYSGRTYWLCDYDGGSHFESVKGNLNSNCSGWNLYLYYTRVNIGIQAVSSITINSTQSGAVSCYYTNGSLHAANVDLNKGAGSSSTDVFMHFGTANKVNRPYPEPSMASNLVYTGSPLKLISSTYSNSNTGTLYYRVNSGSYTSDVNNVTATNAGTYTVYYYSGSNSYGNSSESYAHSKTVTIGKAQNNGATVACADALESDGPSPSVTGTNLSSGAIKYTYATSQSGSYSYTAPSTEGTYWVKATIASDNNYKAYTTAAVSFKLKHDWAAHNSGDSEGNAYVISTTEDLDLLAQRVNAGTNYQGKFFKLGENITYDGSTNNFMPIGTNNHPFAGHFNGNGKTISGININNTNLNYAGIFGYAVSGVTIKNIKLDNSTVSGFKYVGAILGYGDSNNYATIENCLVTSDVTVSGTEEFVGGIAGEFANVCGCVCAANVSGNVYVGGIIGHGGQSNITNCLYTGTSINGLFIVGAITGNKGNATLTNNYYNSTINGASASNMFSISAADGVTITPVGTATTYDVSGITVYADNQGISYGGTLYAGNTEKVKLYIAYTVPDGCTFNGFTGGNGNALTKNNDDSYTLTMTGAVATVTPDMTDLWGVTAGRDGSTAEKAYLITTTAGLDLLAKMVNGTDGYTANNYAGTYFELGNDIDYSEVGLTLDGGKSNYTTIGCYNDSDDTGLFSGHFDGKGHKVSGIVINKDADFQGLFGYIRDAEVKNLTIDDTHITIGSGNQFAGGIVGKNYGTVENCHATGTVTVNAKTGDGIGCFIGGIVGENYGTVSGCTSAATVSSDLMTGAIAGSHSLGIIENCLVLDADVSADYCYGAIIGKNDGGSLNNNRYTATTKVNNVIGDGHATTDINSHSYDITGQATVAYEFAVATGAMGAAGTTYGTGNYTGITPYANGLAYNGKYYCSTLWSGNGTSSDPYVIYNTEGLDKLATDVNGGMTYEGKFFELGADITYDYATLGEGENNYTAIGTSDRPFAGTFDGKGHTISGIRINKDEYNQGIFGYVNADGTVKNLFVSDCSIETDQEIGGIAAGLSGTIENCHVDSNVTLTGHACVGGIVAEIEGGTVKGCTSAATIIGTEAGGYKAEFLGGIVGEATVHAEVSPTLTDNLFTGTISGELLDYIGAIVGKNNATLTNNYHTLSNMGGVGKEDDAIGSDEAGAQIAYEFTAATNAMGAVSTTYGTDTYTGITAYASGLACNGKYYCNFPWSGIGLRTDPYIIYNTAGMDKLARDVNSGTAYDGKFFELGADITYDKTVENNYTPIGDTQNSFFGYFDGNGHTISGIRISDPNGVYKAIFGVVYGTVKNLVVSDCRIDAYQTIGGIVTYLYGTIENCHVGSDVTLAGNSYIGGIAVVIEGGTVKGCTSAATIIGTKTSGLNAFTLGGISGYAKAYLGDSPTLTDNLFTGTISGELRESIGAIVGWNKNNSTNFTNNFHTCGAIGSVGNEDDATSSDVEGAQFAVSSTTKPDGFGDATKTYGKDSYIGIKAYGSNGLEYGGRYYYVSTWGGKGTEKDPYIIYNIEGMDKLASDVNSGTAYSSTFFELGADITYDKTVTNNYTPIGNINNLFSGTFDGKGHTISGIRISDTDGGEHKAIFGFVEGTVKNLVVSDCRIEAYKNIGGIVETLLCGTIENCHVGNDVTLSGSSYIGGIAAENDGGTIKGSTSAATIIGTESNGNNADYLGGIVGFATEYADDPPTLTDNLFTGTISGELWKYIGAIVGLNNNNSTTLTNNYHTCSGMGGVGKEGNVIGSDDAGALFAVSSTTAPAEATIGTAGTPYAKGETYQGITPYTSGLLYNGSYYWHGAAVQRGDANGDGNISVTDIAVVVNCILQLDNNGGFSDYGADANGDGQITVTDIGVIVDKILGVNNNSNAASRRLLLQEVEPQ